MWRGASLLSYVSDPGIPAKAGTCWGPVVIQRSHRGRGNYIAPSMSVSAAPPHAALTRG